MNKIKNYCLNLMNITQWQIATKVQYDYLIVIDCQEAEYHHLDLKKQQLLERMLQALHWGQKKTHHIFLSVADINAKQSFLYQLNTYQPQKILIFGDELGVFLLNHRDKLFRLSINEKQIKGAVLPFLSTLMDQLDAKKQAWKIMQSLMSVEREAQK